MIGAALEAGTGSNAKGETGLTSNTDAYPSSVSPGPVGRTCRMMENISPSPSRSDLIVCINVLDYSEEAVGEATLSMLHRHEKGEFF